jgi:hypothetical protein
VKKLHIALVLALSAMLAAPASGLAGRFRQKPAESKSEQVKGGHTKNARGSSANKHQLADGRRAREQKAAAERAAEAQKAAARRRQVAKEQRAHQKKGM